MKSLFLKLGQPVSGIAQFSSIVSANTDLETENKNILAKKINITEQEKSKLTSLIFQDLKNKRNQLKILTEKLIPELKYWVYQKYVNLNFAFIPSVGSVLSTGATLSNKIELATKFKAVAAGFAFSGVSLALHYKMSEIEKNIEKLQEKIRKYIKLFFENNNKFIDIFGKWHDKIWSHTSYGYNAISLILFDYSPKNFPIKWYDKFLNSLKKGVEFKALGLLSLGNDIIAILLNRGEEAKTEQALKYIQNKENELKNILEDLNKKIESWEEEKWVVINETHQTNDYSCGGRGGRNLIFRNTKTNEEKTIDQMLRYSKEELKVWGSSKSTSSQKRMIYKKHSKQNQRW
ncbi:Uncharacterised protein [Mycoplasmopsis citelli]|uniref:Uncharacterized protein n=1 Tax=Mycoplasmopsis citelli TaxID=171281 RepID=A0A449B222_9BACT|nr:hypothetical protein [Mycoplasmopsis citelli]VEU74642.1 Uncharacterised protein [Mycoplasmopsis citelli]